MIYTNTDKLKFYASGTCADIYLTNDDKIVKVVKLNDKHEFDSKKRAIKSCYAEHELINLIGVYKSYGVHISKKYGYITMDKVPGKSLHTVFEYNEFKYIDAGDAIQAIIDWTKQLYTLHDLGVCHYSLHKANLFIYQNKGFIIDFGNAILDIDYDDNYKFLVMSDQIKNNGRKIFHISQDFRFFCKNVKKFIDNVESIRHSNEYYKIKKISKYLDKKIKSLKQDHIPKYNHCLDFYNFLTSL